MKNRPLIAVMIAIFTFCLTGCEEKKVEPSRQEMISKTWKVGQVIVNGSVDGSSDYSSYRYEFQPSGTYIFSGSNRPTRQGKWEFTSTQQKIILDKSTPAEEIVLVISLTEASAELEFTVPATYKSDEQKMLVKLQL
jgi:hypothetical protein